MPAPAKTEYWISARAYFDRLSQDPNLAPWAAQCRPAIAGIIARYGLGGQSVLSLGPGTGFEERTFFEAGCPLCFVEIERAYESTVAAIPAGGDLHFIYADAADYLREAREVFDVLYVSSFPPDEERRGRIQREWAPQRTVGQKISLVTWPNDAKPYHDTIIRAFERVRDGGMIILQHYSDGVSLDRNPHYLVDVEKQFEAADAQLLEVYCFRRSPGHALVVAIKGGAQTAAAALRKLANRPQVKTFHGRYHRAAVRNNVMKVFGPQSESFRFSLMRSMGRRVRARLRN